ncbi:MAG: hypothetical protein ACOCUY_01380 [Verrucomicrobiota bacterium]
MKLPIRTIRWRRTADRLGPKRLLSLCLEPGSSEGVLLSRKHDTVRWEDSFSLPAYDDASQGKELKQALQKFAKEADYITMVTQLPGALLRLISFPGRPPKDDSLETRVRQTLGVDETYLVRSQQVAETQHDDKPEFSVLACALPVQTSKVLAEIASDVGMLGTGLTMGGVAAANLVHCAEDGRMDEDATAFLHMGNDVSQLLVFRGKTLTVIREFQLGRRTIINSLMKNMDLDEETTLKLFLSGSFDIGSELVPALGPWLHHIVISLDFCERRYGDHPARLQLCGCGAQSKTLHSAIAEKIGRPVVEWDPLSSMSRLSMPRRSDFEPREHLLAFSEGYRFMEPGVTSK